MANSSVKTTTVLRKQPAMRKVLLGLMPCAAGSVYYFGWRSLAMILFCCAVGVVTEWLFCRTRKEPVTEAVFVTSVLFALIMPPGVGWHVLAIGTAFGVAFSKEVFGGFGRNIFNPAMAGRCFVYICFPVALTGVWQPAATERWGALNRWTTAVAADGSAAVTSATPLAHMKAGRLALTYDTQADRHVPFLIGDQETVVVNNRAFYKMLFLGNLSGTMGVTSAMLILIGGVYLFWTQTASRTTILSVIIPYAVLNFVLYRLGVKPLEGAMPALLGGGFLLGAFFMATDPVSSPKTEPGRIFYGVIIAVGTLVIRNFSIFNGGLMFSILLGNMFAPILDYGVKAWQDRGKGAAAEVAR